MKVRLLLPLLLLLGFVNLLQAQSVRKYSNEFLKIGVGARAAAMGNAMTGIVGDATAGYWNPAGLDQAPKSPEIALMHSEYFGGIAKYDYVGFTMPIDDKRRFGATLIRLGVDDIANTLNLVDQNGVIDFGQIESFSVADLALMVSLSQELVPGLHMGGSMKVVNRSVGKFANAWGFGLDAGIQYKTGNLFLGLMVSDITSTFNAWTFNTETFEDAFIQTGNVIPENSLEITLPAAKMGAGYKFFKNKKLGLLLSLDNDVHFDGERNVLVNLGPVSFDPHMGMELDFKQKIFLRGGFKNLQKVPNDDGDRVFSVFPTLGAGFTLKNLSVDYALSNVGNFSQTLYSHVFSLKYNFGKFKN